MEYALLGTASVGEAAEIWNKVVARAAEGREGLVRLQLLAGPASLLAIGTWKDKSQAEAFMRTGVFKTLMEQLGPLLESDPVPRTWTQAVLVSP